MAAARPALSAAACSQCRLRLLNYAFAPVALPTALPRHVAAASARARRPNPSTNAHALSIRRFSSLPVSQHPSRSSELKSQPDAELDAETHTETSTSPESSATDAPVPWYLQVDPPTHIAPIELPALPDVPPDAPPLIRTLLQYASEDMGLDDLNLLDLRRLDPPPALGPDLFMLFGTARSERHLNVSAGRLVRWLRAKHRVHADADGLLGPNERKTKLRRKARRAKLLGTMGSDDADDGIRTGWICVNLGTVDRGADQESFVAADGRSSGFGVTQSGSSVVVQLMTESRRREMDLEALWTGALDRSLATSGSDVNTRKPKQPADHLDPVERAILANVHRPPTQVRSHRSKATPGPWLSNQARFYSTGPSIPLDTSFQDPFKALDPLRTTSADEMERLLTYDAESKHRLLGLLHSQLLEMSDEAAAAALHGTDPATESSPFLELMEHAMQTLPPSQTWKYRLALQHRGTELSIGRFTESLKDVRVLVDEMRVNYAINPSRDQYIKLLYSVLASSSQDVDHLSQLALEVLSSMHQRNQAVLANDVLVTIIESVSKSKTPLRAQSRWTTDLLGTVEKLLFLPSQPYMDDSLLIALMTAYARRGSWPEVWNIWQVPPRYLRPRSRALYCSIFKLAINTNSKKICADVTRRCVHDMFDEEPPVLPTGDVRKAALECLSIADHNAEEYATIPVDTDGVLGKLANREFTKYVRLIKEFET
ncbi:hypothetical protein F5Y18DRAFT_385045 [Xylariaceae sp. FL1019]|nr:hypothetical protein F5Y18DRAFT_385045 [Xylariaceae sp. FL1019]